MALVDYPLALLVISLIVQWSAAFGGRFLRRTRMAAAADPQREEIVTVLNASLTLLALLIGFSFAMAVSRYDQRKNCEEAEANAIGTEYLRADLLPPANALRAHSLLVAYGEQRIAHYEESDPARLKQIDAETARVQSELWTAVAGAAATTPSATMMLVAGGMNDVINTQGYTQAAWWNRIPVAAWVLILTVAIACNALLGRVESRVNVSTLLVLPLILSISLFLIADIDSPRAGGIRVTPQNLIAAVRALPPRPPPLPG